MPRASYGTWMRFTTLINSATLAAHLARGESVLDAARAAARSASDAVAHGLEELGVGEGPVDVLHVKGAR